MPKNIISGMGLDSKILIDETVLSYTGWHSWSACLDLHIHAVLGFMERYLDRWFSSMDKWRLKIMEDEYLHASGEELSHRGSVQVRMAIRQGGDGRIA